MHDNNKYYFSEEEFDKILLDYHDSIGFTQRETHFDTLFFEKGILFKYCGRVAFRYPCIIEYCIAKKAEQDNEFLKNSNTWAEEALWA